jgi:hypothetical protein
MKHYPRPRGEPIDENTPPAPPWPIRSIGDFLRLCHQGPGLPVETLDEAAADEPETDEQEPQQ